jgi:membrane associated rhomboid family serine protease
MLDKEDRGKIWDALLFNGAFLLIIWVLWWYERETGDHLTAWGTRPRTARGAIGIITTPFLHGSLDHISGNSLSFATLSTFLIFFYREIAFRVIFWLYLLSGILLWLIAVSGNHIGVSGVIYGLAAFLFFSGIIRQNMKLLRVSMAVAFLYGSIVWWVLPIDPQISWEGHLAGSIIGIGLAIVYRDKGPQREKYNWEIEEELEALAEQEQEADILSEDDEDDHDDWFSSESSDGTPIRWIKSDGNERK